MAFEVYVPRSGFSNPVATGKFRIGKAGHGVINAADAQAIGIHDGQFIAMIDKSGGRLALRATRDGEFGLRLNVKTKKGRPMPRNTFNANGLLAALGLDPAKMHGDYDLLHKDDLLIVHFNAVSKRK